MKLPPCPDCKQLAWCQCRGSKLKSQLSLIGLCFLITGLQTLPNYLSQKLEVALFVHLSMCLLILLLLEAAFYIFKKTRE